MKLALSFLAHFTLISSSDVNECQLGSYSCHAQAQCVNVPGSYECKCLTGYYGDGNSTCVKKGKSALCNSVMGRLSIS